MNTNNPNQNEFFQSQDSPILKLHYPNSRPEEFIYTDDFALFELTLRHQNAVQASGHDSLIYGRGEVVIPDGSAIFRALFEKLETAFKTALKADSSVKLVRLELGQAKGKLIEKSPKPIIGETALTTAERDNTILARERSHSYAALRIKEKCLKMQQEAAIWSLDREWQELAARVYLIESSAIKHLAMHNLLCAHSLLRSCTGTFYKPAHVVDKELLDGERLIADQWHLKQPGMFEPKTLEGVL